MLLLLAGGGFCHAQDVVLLENHQRIHVYNCRVNSGRIVYSDPSITDTIIDTRVDIHGYGQPIQVSITCFYQTADDSAEHRISISQSTYPSLLVNQEIPDYGTIFNATTNGGDATIQINCRSDSVQSISIDISWSTASTTPMCNTNSASFHIGRLTHNSATVVWNSGGQSSEIVLNGNHFYGWSDSIHITGLEPNTIYTVDACAQSDSDKPCCHTSLTFITNPEPIIGCPDLTDLQAYYVRGTYGGAGNPYANIGIIDTEVKRTVYQCCDAALNDGMVSFIYGKTRIGKSESLKAYAREHNHGKTIYIEMGSGWTRPRLVRELALHFGNGVKAKRSWMLEDAIFGSLTRYNLLIIDEFHLALETSTDASAKAMMEFVREVYDRTGCGLVMSATKVGLAGLEGGKNQLLFDQLRRRGVVKVVLPDVPPVRDINTIARSFDLPLPAGEVLAGIKQLVKTRGLGVFIKYLQKSYAVCRKAKTELSWDAYRKVVNGYLALGAMKSEY